MHIPHPSPTRKHDMLVGPCKCGAWHLADEWTIARKGEVYTVPALPIDPEADKRIDDLVNRQRKTAAERTSRERMDLMVRINAVLDRLGIRNGDSVSDPIKELTEAEDPFGEIDGFEEVDNRHAGSWRWGEIRNIVLRHIESGRLFGRTYRLHTQEGFESATKWVEMEEHQITETVYRQKRVGGERTSGGDDGP